MTENPSHKRLLYLLAAISGFGAPLASGNLNNPQTWILAVMGAAASIKWLLTNADKPQPTDQGFRPLS